MPRYLNTSDVPAILQELQGTEENVWQSSSWQERWVETLDQPVPNAAVLSYRWRNRGRNENVDDYWQWLQDVGTEGYNVWNVRQGAGHVEWSLADDMPVQIEVAVWMLWIYAQRECEYIWIDQFCVPQDVDVPVKMGHIRESPGIYAKGKVWVVLAPVVDYDSGNIVNRAMAHQIVSSYSSEFNNRDRLGAVARKALLVNASYMRRVWTIQETVAPGRNGVQTWPLKGDGNELNSYQSIYIIDWPEFNAWNSWPGTGELRADAAHNKALQDYTDGDYTAILEILREHPSNGIAYLANMSSGLMWITMDRNGLVNDLIKGDRKTRAHKVLNSHQVAGARSFLPEDKVLALVPLIGYQDWQQATKGAQGHELVQASVTWAYSICHDDLPQFRWSMRIYNSHSCSSAALDSLTPRRNFSDRTAIKGAQRGASAAYSARMDTLTLGDGTSLQVAAACIMPHPGVPSLSWGEGPWTKAARNALKADESLRLSMEWSAEQWLESAKFDKQRVAVFICKPSSRDRNTAYMVVAALPTGSGAEARRGQLMLVMDFTAEAIDSVAGAFQKNCQAMVEEDFQLTSPGS